MFSGQCNHFLGQYEEALQNYDLAVKKNNKDPQNFYNRGLTFVALQRF
jgi:tetratricopeptide (TPR) repeat protein